MVKSFDDLIGFLLDEIALCGDEGARPSDFLSYLDTFYDNSSQDKGADADSDLTTLIRPSVDRLLQEQVWRWLTKHPEVRVGKDNESRHLSLSEAEGRRSSSQSQAEKAQNRKWTAVNGPKAGPSTATPARVPHDQQPSLHTVEPLGPDARAAGESRQHEQRQSNVRLYTSEERMWNAVAGHGPDLQRIPKMEFACLSIITSRREVGILQADLIKITGQDKRSLPKRTQNLHDHGYIEKRNILFKGTRTSWLYAKRFVSKSTDLNTVIPEKEVEQARPTAPQHPDGTIIDYRAVWNALFEILHSAKSNMITNTDLTKKLEVWHIPWKARHRLTVVRRLETIGLVKEVYAQALLEGRLSSRRYRCLKLVREPTEADWKAFVATSHHSPDETGIERQAQQVVFDDDQSEGGMIANAMDDVDEDDEIPVEDLQESERPVPQWTSDQPISNFIFDLIDNAGEKGISTMDIQSWGLGDAWKKPIENLLGRLVDHWQLSQPLHLRHLAVIRDTALVGKIPHYVHYSFGNFRSLVDRGVTSWEAVAAKNYTSKKQTKMAVPSPEAQADLDDNGFPKLSPHVFQGTENEATLAECVHATKAQPLPFSGPGKRNIGRPRKHKENTPRPVSGDLISHENSDTTHTEPSPAPELQHNRKPQNPYKGKQRGRPRKVPKLGLPKDFNKLPSKEQHRLLRLKQNAIRYASERAEKEISRRVEDGIELGAAREAVFTEIDAQHIRSGEEPISGAIKAFLGLPQMHLYMPSIAAHTRPCFSAQDPVDEAAVVKEKPRTIRQSKKKGQSSGVTATTQYLPSRAAHTFPYYGQTGSAIQSKKRKRESMPQTSPPPKQKRQRTRDEFYERLSLSIPRLGDRNLLVSERGRDPSRRGQPNGKLAIFKLQKLGQLPWFSLTTTRSATPQISAAAGYHEQQLPTTATSPVASESNPNIIQDDPSASGVMGNSGTAYALPYSQSTQWNLQQLSTEVSRKTVSRQKRLPDHPTAILGRRPKTANSDWQGHRQSEKTSKPHILDAVGHENLTAAQTHNDLAATEPNTMRDEAAIHHRESNATLLPDATEMSANTAVREGGQEVPAKSQDITRDHQQHVQPETQATTSGGLASNVDGLNEVQPSAETEEGISYTSPTMAELAAGNFDRGTLPQLVVEPAGQLKIHRQKKTAGGSLALMRKNIILDLLEKAGGVIPGDKSLEAPFIAEWKRLGQAGSPDTATVKKTVVALCVAGKVRKITFSFRNRKGATVTKTMVATNEMSATDPLVLETQRGIMFFDPLCYYPNRLEVPADWDASKRYQSITKKDVEEDPTPVSLYHKPLYVEKSEERGRAVQERRQLRKQMMEVKERKKVTKLLTTAGEKMRSAGLLEKTAQAGMRTANEQYRLMQDYHAAYTALTLAESSENPVQQEGQSTAADHMRTNETIQRLVNQYYATLVALVPAEDLASLELPQSLIAGSAIESADAETNGHTIQPYLFWLGGPTKTHDIPNTVGRLASLKTSELKRSFNPLHRSAPSYVISKRNPLAGTISLLRMSEGTLQPVPRLQWKRIEAEEREREIAEHPTAIATTPDRTSQPPPWEILGLRSINAVDRALRETFGAGTLSQKAEGVQSDFGNDIQELLAWELEHSSEDVVAFEGWPFVNHTMGHPHEELELYNIDMDRALEVSASGKNGCIVIKPFNQQNQIQPSTTQKWAESSGNRTMHSRRTEQNPVRKTKTLVTNEEAILRSQRQANLNEGTFRVHIPDGKALSELLMPDEQAMLELLLSNERVESGILMPFELATSYMEPTKKTTTEKTPTKKKPTEKKPTKKSLVKETPTKEASTKKVSTEKGVKRKLTPPKSVLKRRRLTQPTDLSPVELESQKTLVQRVRFRGPRKPRVFGEENEKRLLVAIIVIRTIVGGLDKRIDWVLVSKVFQPEFDEMFIHGVWAAVRAKHKSQVEKLTSDFQAIFPKAYEERAVPPLDFDHLEDYPWRQLVDWAMENINLPTHSSLDLPATRSEVDKVYALKEASTDDLTRFFEANYEVNSQVKRQAIQNKNAFVCPIFLQPDTAPDADRSPEFEVLKSYVRATIATPSEAYDFQAAHARLRNFNGNEVPRAIDELVAARVIVGQKDNRVIPGRNYALSKICIDTISKHPSVQTLRRAATFKRDLDRGFREDGGSIVFDNLDRNEHSVVILNLLAHGRVKLRPHNPPMNKWGLLIKNGIPNYQSRQMDKRRLHFAIEISPTDSYIDGNPLPPLPAAPAPHLTPPPRTKLQQRIPLWYSIHDQPIPTLWNLARSAVLALVMLRPGISKADVVKGVQPVLGYWEVELLLGWLRDVGAVEEVGGGWGVREWWWLCFDGEEEEEEEGEKAVSSDGDDEVDVEDELEEIRQDEEEEDDEGEESEDTLDEDMERMIVEGV